MPLEKEAASGGQCHIDYDKVKRPVVILSGNNLLWGLITKAGPMIWYKSLILIGKKSNVKLL